MVLNIKIILKSRRLNESNSSNIDFTLAKIMMSIVFVFIVLHFPKMIMALYEVNHISNSFKLRILFNFLAGFYDSRHPWLLPEWLHVLCVFLEVDRRPHHQIPRDAQQLGQLHNLLLCRIILQRDAFQELWETFNQLSEQTWQPEHVTLNHVKINRELQRSVTSYTIPTFLWGMSHSPEFKWQPVK